MAFTTISGASGVTSITGTSGVDTTTIVNLAGPVLVEALGAADTVQISIPSSTSISDYSLKGGDGNDTIISNAIGITGTLLVDSFIAGNAGNDLIGSTSQAFEGSTVQGGQGNDAIRVGSISTTLVNGNKENDVIELVGTMQSSSVLGGQGADVISINSTSSIGTLIDGSLGGDAITLQNIATFVTSTITGGEGDDSVNADFASNTAGLIIDGGIGNDTLRGGFGNDSLIGAAGNDSISGGNGKDTLLGGEGNDVLFGGAGVDSLSGGLGVNTFVFASAAETFSGASLLASEGVVDAITDYTSASTISFNGISAVSPTQTLEDPTSVNGYATWAAAFAAGTGVTIAAGKAELVAIGSGTSFTSYLFVNTAVGAGVATGAIQLGAVGQYATPGQAQSLSITLAPAPFVPFV